MPLCQGKAVVASFWVVITLSLAFIISWVVSLLLIRCRAQWMQDHKQSGPQKFHQAPTPRLGGMAILVGFTLALILNLLRELWATGWPGTMSLQKDLMGTFTQTSFRIGPLGWVLVLSTLPVFLGGIWEDITKKISPRMRLTLAVASGLLWVVWGHGTVIRWDFPPLDGWVTSAPWLGMLLTVFLLSGVSHAYNIIDGFNGLASMVAFLVNGAIFYVAYHNQDQEILGMCLALGGAILGFLFWNFPRGLIFLGDGGAYFLGFFLGGLSILLVNKHSSVSPWFAFLIHLYPVTETLYSIYRRKIRRSHATAPDALHFHSLLYRRIMRWALPQAQKSNLRNSLTSPYLWAMSIFTLGPAMLFWRDKWALVVVAGVFCLTYFYLYYSLVRFKTPRILKIPALWSEKLLSIKTPSPRKNPNLPPTPKFDGPK